MQTVNIEGFGTVHFPDELTPEQITQAIEQDILPQMQQMPGGQEPAEGQSQNMPGTGPILPGESISTITGRPVQEGELLRDRSLSQGAKETISAVARPTLEGGGALVGGLAGSPTGPWGTVGGGALGYAGGKKAADILDEQLGLREPEPLPEQLLQTGKDVAMGAAYEAGGQIAAAAIVPVIRGGKLFLQRLRENPFTARGMEQAAGDLLIAHTSEGPIYARNSQEAAFLEKEIPELRFTAGQRTADPELIKLERSQFRKPGGGATASAEQVAQNNAALKAYYQKNFGGKEGIDNVLGAVEQKQGILSRTAQIARESAEAEAARLRGMDPQESGQVIQDAIRSNRGIQRQAAGQLYDEIPDQLLPVDDLVAKARQIAQPRNRFEDPGNIPEVFGRVLKEFDGTEGASLSFQDLRGLRTTLLDEIRTEKAAVRPNAAKLSRLEEFRSAIDETIDALGQGEGEAAQRFRDASRGYREYKETFGQGTVGDILRPGPRGEQSRVEASQIAAKFFKNTETADQFLRAASNSQEARQALRDYAAYDLLQSAADPATRQLKTSRLQLWISRKRPVLQRLGILDEFSSLERAQVAADKAAGMAQAFEKSAAAKLLKVDPEQAIASAFSGGNAKASGRVARELLETVKDDPAAVKGLRRAFADHLLNLVETTAQDIAGSARVSPAKFDTLMEKWRPAMRVLYKDSPKQLRALVNMQRAYRTMARNTTSPIGGGSDTAENILTAIRKTGLEAVSSHSMMLRAAKGLANVFRKHSDSQVDMMLTRALFDPDYAEVLVEAARGKIKPDALGKIVDGKIFSLDAYRKARLGNRIAAGVAGAVGGSAAREAAAGLTASFGGPAAGNGTVDQRVNQ